MTGLAVRLEAHAGTVTEERPGDYRVAGPATRHGWPPSRRWLAEHELPSADLRAGRQSLEDVYLRRDPGPRATTRRARGDDVAGRRATAVTTRSRRTRGGPGSAGWPPRCGPSWP